MNSFNMAQWINISNAILVNFGITPHFFQGRNSKSEIMMPCQWSQIKLKSAPQPIGIFTGPSHFTLNVLIYWMTWIQLFTILMVHETLPVQIISFTIPSTDSTVGHCDKKMYTKQIFALFLQQIALWDIVIKTIIFHILRILLYDCSKVKHVMKDRSPIIDGRSKKFVTLCR